MNLENSDPQNELLLDRNSAPSSGEDALYELLFGDDGENDVKPSSDEAFQYLQDLNSFHLDRLNAEPFVLRDKQAHCSDEIKSLAFSNYKTFVRTAQCSREIYADFAHIDERLDEVIAKLPSFSLACDSFTKSIQIINQQRRGNTLTLQKHTQLLEFLEISQLMDTCVRNEYYEEALDLAAYVKRLDKKYGQSIALVQQQIVQDVNKSLNLMLKQLLQQLKTNLQFNQCLKVIGLIRRLDVFSESELRIKFLQLRDAWLQSLLASIPQQDPYAHITKTIEENRVHLFDIITQYRAIFSDDETGLSFAASKSELNESKLFYTWMQQKIKNFLAVLSNDLKLGVGNRIDSVLSQSMYFGLAFSRVGLDFRALMVPIFEKAILDQFEKTLQQAGSKFEESLSRLNWSELAAEGHHQRQDSSSTLRSSTSNLIVNPPLAVMDFHPLAVYLNIVLNSLNELRLCAPLSLHSRITNEIRASIKNLAAQIRDYHSKEKLDKTENQLFSQMLGVLGNQMIPFIERCVWIIFPVDQLQKAYGFTQADVVKLKESMKLDYKQLMGCVVDLIPSPPPIQSSIKEEEKLEKSHDLEAKHVNDEEISPKENEQPEVENSESQNLSKDEEGVVTSDTLDKPTDIIKFE